MSKHQSVHYSGPNSFTLGFFPLKSGAVRVVDLAHPDQYEMTFHEGMEAALDQIEKLGAFYAALSLEQRAAYHQSVICFVRYFFDRPVDLYRLPVSDRAVEGATWSFAVVDPRRDDH